MGQSRGRHRGSKYDDYQKKNDRPSSRLERDTDRSEFKKPDRKKSGKYERDLTYDERKFGALLDKK